MWSTVLSAASTGTCTNLQLLADKRRPFQLQVNLAVHLFPGLHAPALILGTIAGCGGRILADGIMTGWQVRKLDVRAGAGQHANDSICALVVDCANAAACKYAGAHAVMDAPGKSPA